MNKNHVKFAMQLMLCVMITSLRQF